MVTSVQESLARLQIPYIDIIQCHDIEFGSLDQVRTWMLEH
jgi:L-galactose dehydrogenase